MYQPRYRVRLRQVRRRVAATLLAFFVGGVLVLPAAHDLSAGGGAVAGAHVEQAGEHACRPVHLHLNCSLGQAGIPLAVPGENVGLAIHPPRLLGTPADVASSSPYSSHRGDSWPRAPPLS
jgi:hypothetical protein